MYQSDKLHEECGIVGVYGNPDAANLVYLGLYALQHRGQEASGIVTHDGNVFYQEKGVGLVADVFNAKKIGALKGSASIGHNRYSTMGSSALANVQPLMGNYSQGTIAMVHNGNLVNAVSLRKELEKEGAVFQSTVDSEVILHLLARSSEKTLTARIISGLSAGVRGAYSLLFLSKDSLIGVRDPYGVRPLLLGKLKEGYVLASESCVFDLIGADLVRDIEPGEVIKIDEGGITSYKPFPPTPMAQCVFEFIYFSRPDSVIFSQSVYDVRKRLGWELAKESNVSADIVIAVPDSGVLAALGFAEAAMIPYTVGIIRNHYVGRTFIEPKEAIRHFGVKVKLNAIRSVLKGKRVIVVDDSIVRGTTSQKIVKMIRDAGAKEIHVRISSPPILSPCFYGIDTPTREELVASYKSVDEIRELLTADSLQYLSQEGMFRAVYQNASASNKNFCTACFTEQYPIPLGKEMSRQLGLFDNLVSSDKVKGSMG
jgi:amidophosphoribosyltransferase